MTEENKPIKQHYIPKFYLKGFTESAKETDYLYVFEQNTEKQYKSRPNELATQKDIYTLDTDDGEAKYAVEKFLGEIESGVASIIQNIIENEKLPSGKDYTLLMEFIAIMESRVPRAIGQTNQLYDQIMRLVGKTSAQSKELFESQMNAIRAEGKDVGNVSFEEYKEFVDSDEYDIVVDQNTLMKYFIESVNIIFQPLCDRTWSICKIQEENHYFICSDHPVFLGWTIMPKVKWMQHSPGQWHVERTEFIVANQILSGETAMVNYVIWMN